MKPIMSTLFLTFVGLAATIPAPVTEPDAASVVSGLEARQNVNWYGIRDVSWIALDRLNGGVADAIINLARELPDDNRVQYPMQQIRGCLVQMSDALEDINGYAISKLTPYNQLS